MEIYLSEDKAVINDIDIEACYHQIDEYFLSQGVEIVSKGIYKCARQHFTAFVIAQAQLPDTNWFLKIIDSWYMSYFGNTSDSLEYHEDALKAYYNVMKLYNEYVRNKKNYQFRYQY